jgi:opacity protein-like surface antigen
MKTIRTNRIALAGALAVITLTVATPAAVCAADADVAVTTTETETTTTETKETPDSPYVMAGGVYGIENDSQFSGDLSNSGGYDLRLGYSFKKMFAAELEWQSLVNFKVKHSDVPTLEARMVSLNGRIAPLSGRIQPYGLFGFGWYNVQADREAVSVHESSFGLRFGIGVLGMITERIGLSLEAAYILPTTGDLGGKHSFDLIPITASFFFRFS